MRLLSVSTLSILLTPQSRDLVYVPITSLKLFWQGYQWAPNWRIQMTISVYTLFGVCLAPVIVKLPPSLACFQYTALSFLLQPLFCWLFFLCLFFQTLPFPTAPVVLFSSHNSCSACLSYFYNFTHNIDDSQVHISSHVLSTTSSFWPLILILNSLVNFQNSHFKPET